MFQFMLLQTNNSSRYLPRSINENIAYLSHHAFRNLGHTDTISKSHLVDKLNTSGQNMVQYNVKLTAFSIVEAVLCRFRIACINF